MNIATTKPRIDPLPTKSSEADDLPTGLVLALVLLFLGGLSWLLCCLWAVCRRLKTGPTNISEGGENSTERNLFLASSKQRTRESNKETYSGPISEGPDYENTRQKSSVYDAMYENWASLLQLILCLYLVLWRLDWRFSCWLFLDQISTTRSSPNTMVPFDIFSLFSSLVLGCFFP